MKFFVNLLHFELKFSKNMKTWFFPLAFIIISFFGGSFASAQSYPYSPPGSVLIFPDDDGKHTDLSTTTEWWYLNMHLIGSAPLFKEYDVMLCYFSKPATMRIFNIADLVSGTFHTDVNQTPFVFSQQAGHWELTYNIPFQISDYSNWTHPTDNITFQYVFHAEEPVNDDGLDVTVTSNRYPLVVGGNGYIAIGGQGDSSYYYSYTNMKAEGTIRYNGVDDNITSGIAWIDRQWGPFMVGINSDNKYEWFCAQADKPNTTLGIPQTPSEFNIWQIFSDSTSVPYQPQWRTVSAIYADNTQDTSSSFFFERTGYWFDSANSVYYSNGWRFIEPDKGVNIDITPKINNQVVNVTLFKFWEGGTILQGTVNNLPVEGVGFAELVAAYDFQIILPSVPSGLTVGYYSDHYSISWTASAQGTYPVGGYRIYRSANNDGYWQYIATTSNLFYNDYSVYPDSAYYYTVTSFDNQTATSASNYATSVHALPLGINSPDNQSGFLKIYPNPTSGKINVEFNKPLNEDFSVRIENVCGKTILTNNFNKKSSKAGFEIDLSACAKGVYFVKIIRESGVVLDKIMKE